MAKDIVNLYAKLLSNYFELHTGRPAISSATTDLTSIPLPKFLPKNANSVHVSDYLTRIIGELANCVNDINLINLAGEAFSGLTELMEQTRWKFVEIICKCWARGRFENDKKKVLVAAIYLTTIFIKMPKLSISWRIGLWIARSPSTLISFVTFTNTTSTVQDPHTRSVVLAQ